MIVLALPARFLLLPSVGRVFVLCMASTLLGLLSWGQDAWPLWVNGFSVLLPVLWAQARHRWCAGVIIALYTLAASRGLIVGIPVFFDSHWLIGVGLWLLAALLPLLMGALCWSSRPLRRVGLIPVLLALWIIPPVAWVGWAHPLTAAGWLFPGGGLGGGLATVGLMMGLAWVGHSQPPIWRLAVLPRAYHYDTDCPDDGHPVGWPPVWQGHHTQYPFDRASNHSRYLVAEWLRHQDLQKTVNAHPDKTIQVFPETVGGVWNERLTQDWQKTLHGSDIQVLMGAYQRIPNSTQYLSGLMQVTKEGAQLIYQQRLPMPGSMWKPWSRSGAVLGGLVNPVVDIADQSVAVFICYESLLMWPLLHSMLYQPDILVSIASTWWAPNSINQAQQQAMHSGSRLWGVPLVEAFNR